MNENLDLVEILKDCPKGTPLYSPIFGNVRLSRICEGSTYPIVVDANKDTWESFTLNGRYKTDYNDAECMLFPSKDMRDWRKFNTMNKRKYINDLKPFDKVLVRNDKSAVWHIDFFEYVDDCGDAVCGSRYARQCVPYNDETKNLLGASDECMEYYKYWED